LEKALSFLPPEWKMPSAMDKKGLQLILLNKSVVERSNGESIFKNRLLRFARNDGFY